MGRDRSSVIVRIIRNRLTLASDSCYPTATFVPGPRQALGTATKRMEAAMETIELKLSTRVPKGKGAARATRRAGMVPGIIYGITDKNTAIAISPREIIRVIGSPRGRNSVLNLTTDSGDNQLAIIRDYTVHPVSRKLLHVDFMRVREDSVLTLNVPMRYNGRPVGVDKGARLVPVVQELKIECRADQIPETIDVDVTPFDLGDSLYSQDVVLPEGVTPAFRTNFPVLTVSQIRVLEVDAPVSDEEGEEGEEGEEAAEGAEASEGSGDSSSDSEGGDGES